jgi:hypothetical protein
MTKRVVIVILESEPGMVEARYRTCNEAHFGDDILNHSRDVREAPVIGFELVPDHSEQQEWYRGL